MVLPQRARGAALVLALLTLLPGAVASHDPNDPLKVHKPDLFPSSLRFYGQDERTPTEICTDVYNFAPTNQGIAPFFDVHLRVDRYVNGTPVLHKEEYQRTRETLAGGRHVTVCWQLDLAAGVYRAFGTADVGNEVDEEDENNNRHVRGYTTLVKARPRPNLEIVPADFAVSPVDGRDGYPQFFRVRVWNTGDEASPPSKVHVRDETGLVAELDVPPLGVRETRELIARTEPSLRPAGTFHAVAMVDPDNLIDESDEFDNLATRTYNILPHPQPDLTVRDVRVNGTLVERRSLRLEAVVSNVGNKTAGTTVYRFEIDGVPVANQSLDRLTPGTNHTLVFPFYLTAGNHTLRVVADGDHKLAELNETNNDLAVFVTVAAIEQERRYPNLVIDRLSALPDNPAPDEVVVVNTYIRNVGEVPSENATLAIVVDGRRIGEVRIPPILPDRYHNALFEWTNASVGLHTVRAFVDAHAEVREIHEDDNNDTLFVGIRPPFAQSVPANRSLEEPVANETPTPEENGTAPPAATPPTTPPPPRDQPANRTVEVTQVSVTTRPVPGGLKGRVSVGLRNPALEPLGRITVSFKVDGQPLKEVLVEGLPPAGLTGTSSGEVDLPPGRHTIEVEARILGAAGSVATATQTYEGEAGEKSVPGPAVALVLLALALAARRKKSDD